MKILLNKGISSAITLVEHNKQKSLIDLGRQTQNSIRLQGNKRLCCEKTLTQ
jgi:hypothetical protein